MATRRLEVQIVGNASNLERTFGRASASTKRFGGEFSRTGRGVIAGSGVFRGLGRAVAFASAGFLGGAGLAAAVRTSFEEMAQSARVTAQTQAVLESTGGAARVSAGHVKALGDQLLSLSGVDDEAVRSMENVLLTFTGVRNEAGAGNKIFDQATKATLDLSVAMGQPLNKSAIQVGRALNDPIRGLTALRRVGVQFSAAQEKQIRGFVKSGNIMAAQKVILRELTKEFGGSAAAAGRTLPGQLNILRETGKNLGGSLAQQLTPEITKITARLNAWFSNTKNQQRVQEAFHQVLTGVGRAISTLRAILGPIIGAVGGLGNAVKILLALMVISKVNAFIGSLRLLTANPYVLTFTFVALGAAAVAAKIKSLQEQQLAAQNRTLAPGSLEQKLLVPKIAGQIANLKGQGLSSQEILARLRKQYGGHLIADDLIAAAFRTSGAPNDTASERGADTAAKAAHGKGLAAASRVAAAASSGIKAGLAKAKFSAAQRNQFFDALIGRRLNAVQDLPLAGQLAGLQSIGAAITARIGKTKDITRKLTLEDQLLQVVRQQKDVRQQLQQQALDALQFKVDRAGATAGFADDLSALNVLRQALIKRIATDKGNLDLQRQLLQVNQQIKDTKEQQRQARIDAITKRQFRQLGLTAEGEEPVAGTKNLRKRLGQVSEAVKGTFLDTDKTKATLARIRKVLGEGLVPRNVRAKLKEMLDGLTDELKNHQGQNQTLFRHANTDAILSGLGLSPAQLKAARQRLSQVGVGGTVPGARSAAFAGAGITTVNTTVQLDGQTVAKNTTKHQNRSKARRSSSRRGPYAGRN